MAMYARHRDQQKERSEMFSGIVEETGVITAIAEQENLLTLTLTAQAVCQGTKRGDSVSVNGVCLTVTRIKGKELTFDLMKETLDATTLKYLRPGHKVNLERSLKMEAGWGGILSAAILTLWVSLKKS